jgi:hypothetical protein
VERHADAQGGFVVAAVKTDHPVVLDLGSLHATSQVVQGVTSDVAQETCRLQVAGKGRIIKTLEIRQRFRVSGKIYVNLPSQVVLG